MRFERCTHQDNNKSLFDCKDTWHDTAKRLWSEYVCRRCHVVRRRVAGSSAMSLDRRF